MRYRDEIGSLFWFVFAVTVVVEALELGIGTLRRPGTGLMAFASAAILGVLSLFAMVRSALKKTGRSEENPFARTSWTRVIAVLVSLALFVRLLPAAGYLIATFLLMTFLFWVIERTRLWKVLLMSAVVTLATYYFFSKYLNCQFPVGIFSL